MIFSFCTFVIFFCSERGIVSMMLIFCWNFSMIYLFVICQWYIRFAIWMFILQQVCSFAQQVDLFSVRDFIISILIIFSFLRQATSSFKESISDILLVMKFVLFKSSIDLLIIANSLSMRAFRFFTLLFICRVKPFSISFKTISEILFVS